jgi:hypothetical protein
VENDAALTDRLFDDGYKAKPERALLFTIEAWDVNCSQHIVTRFTESELETAFNAVKARMAEIESENARLRAALAQVTTQ